MTVFSAKNGCARRTANGIGNHTLIKTHSALGQPVDIWSWRQFGQRATISTNGLKSMVVAHNENDVWPLFTFPFLLIGATKTGKSSQYKD